MDSIGVHRKIDAEQEVSQDITLGGQSGPGREMAISATSIMRGLCGSYAGIQSYKFYRNPCISIGIESESKGIHENP